MIDEQSLIRWLKGADEIFNALEGRGDAYNLCRKWVEEWFSRGKFCITDEDREFLKEFKSMFRLLVNEVVERDRDIPKQKKEEMKNKISLSMEYLLDGLEKYRDKISFAFALYLSSWNIQRFKKYFLRRKDFEFLSYFNVLNKIFQNEFFAIVKKFKNFHLLKNAIEEDSS